MHNKYAAVRSRLELAQECLDEVDETDRNLSLLLDEIIETILLLEYQRSRTSANVVLFRPAPKWAVTIP